MHNLSQTRLILFFTGGFSLKKWDEAGLLGRETAVYRALRPHLGDITFVTYGNFRDLPYAAYLDGINIVCNKWRLPSRWYIFLLSRLYPMFWREPALFKSNQVLGADIALKAARRSGKKFIARCGYLPSTQVIWRHGIDSVEAQKVQQLETTLFQGADQVVVTTPVMRDIIVERCQVRAEKVKIIPNYVDVGRFKPPSTPRKLKQLCYVGRLEEVKNVSALLDAVNGLDVELIIIGGGGLKESLEAKAREEQLPVRFLGNIPNTELPAHLNRASLFVLPSHLEHHPKALLEAMACGLPAIGTNVFGTRELIHHRETGYLCGTSSEEIRAAIQDLMSDTKLQAHISRNAREFVAEHFSLKRVVQMELELLAGLAN